MKNMYVRPQVDLVSFASDNAIAMDHEWGWEDDVFSTPESRKLDNENTEGGEGNEG